MQPRLERLIRALRQERCPQRVLDEVRRRTAAPASRPASGRFARPMALALAALVLLCSLAVWSWSTVSHGRSPARVTGLTTPDRIRIANETQDALGLMGRVLANAGTRSEKILSDRAVPPLRNSLQTTKNSLIHHHNP